MSTQTKSQTDTLSRYEVAAAEAQRTKTVLEGCSVATLLEETYRWQPYYMGSHTDKAQMVRTILEQQYSPVTLEIAFGWNK